MLVTMAIIGGLPAVAACASNPNPVWMTGFEHGVVSAQGGGLFDNVVVTSGGSITPDSTVTRHGAYSLKVDRTTMSGSTYLEKQVSGPVLVMRFSVRLESLAMAQGGTHLMWIPQANGDFVRFEYQVSGSHFYVWWNGGSVSTGTITVAEDTWYTIDLKVDLSAATSRIDWAMNGVAQTAITKSATPSTVTSVRLGTDYGLDPAFTANYDDVMLSMTGTDYPIGDQKILRLRPTGTGTHSSPGDLQNNDGSAIDATTPGRLDDIPMSSMTDYVQQVNLSTTSYAELTYEDTTESCVSAASGVLAYSSQTGTANHGKTSFFSGATESIVYDGDMSETTLFYKSSMITPSSSWTPEVLNGLKARVGYSGDEKPPPYWESLIVEYAVSELPPPTLTSTPGTLGNDTTPTWAFTGDTGATFECELVRGTTVISALAACNSPQTYDLTSQVDGTYTFSVRQRSPGGDTSVFRYDNYTLDKTSPAMPAVTSTTPASPANNNSPRVKGSAEASSTVRLYTNSTCTSVVAGSGTATGFAGAGILVSVADNTTTTFWATATDAAGNPSACSSTSATYTEDSAAPGQPTVTSSDPPSPADNNNPKIIGSAEAASTVRLYTNSTCTSAIVASGTAASFASPGLAVTVPDGSLTTFYATATDPAANTSACSTSLVTYLEITTGAGEGGGEIVFSSRRDGNFDLFRMQPDGTNVVQLTTDSTGSNLQPGWGTDSNTVAFSSSRTGSPPGIWKVNRDGSGITLLTGTTNDDAPDWSPDGTQIAFDSSRDGDSDVYVMSSDGTGVVQLTNVAGSDGQPDWSPNGSRIAFESFRDGDAEIFVMDADGSDLVQLTTNSSNDQAPSWSPDGTQITFMSLRDGNWEIYVMNADGSGQTRISTDAATDLFPVWSPDGTRIGFISTRGFGTTGDVYSMYSDGTGIARMTYTPENEDSLDWFAAASADTTPPDPPTLTSINPSSPSANNNPKVIGSSEADSTLKLYTDSTCTSPVAATGTAADFASPGLQVSVVNNSSTTFWGTATDAASNVSTCSTTSVTYVEDSAAPAAPTFNGTVPLSPANNNSPLIVGSAEAGSTVKLYTDSACTSAVAGTASAATFSSPGIGLSVADDTTNAYWSTASDAAGNSSACSTTSVIYEEDSTAPGLPTFSATNPASPANDNSPRILGNAESDASVKLYSDSSCASPIVASGTGMAFASPGLQVTVGNNTATTFFATATDAADNTSGCSTSSITYVEDSTTPAAPTFTSTSPASPGNQNSPLILGSAEAGSTVDLYTDSACSSSLAATGTSAAFNSPGLGVTVSDNSTTSFYATARDAAQNTSGCSSSSITYVEDSSAPAAPTISSSPPDPASDPNPSWSFTGEAGGTFECELSQAGASVFAFGPCSGSKSYNLTLKPDGTYTFSVRQTDAAGNTGPVATDDYTLDRAEPSPPSLTSTNPASPSNNNTPSIIGSAEAGSTVRVYTNSDCTSSVAATGSATQLSSPGLSVTVAENSTTSFYATATDAAGNPSTCSGAITYVEDSAAPAEPSFSGTNPASPANENNPHVLGTAEAGSTVRLFTNSACTTAVQANGTAAEFNSPGLSVSMPDNSSTTYWATATDAAGNISACSTSTITYVEDSTAPAAPTITAVPDDIDNDVTPEWSFTGEAGVTFECGLLKGTTIVYALGPCDSPHEYGLTTDATYTFKVHAVKGGIAGPDATDEYTLDTTFPPPPTITATPPDPDNDKTPTWLFNGEGGAIFECELSSGGAPVYVFDDCIGSQTYDLTLKPDGIYLFSVRQTDVAGNTSVSATDDYTLDTAEPAAPSLTILPPDPGSDVTPIWEFTGEIDASFQCELSEGGTILLPFGSCDSPHEYDLTLREDGAYTFAVRQIDVAGNVSPISSDDYTLDRSGPAVSLTEVPPDPGKDATPTWEFTGEAGSTFQCELSQGTTVLVAFAACTSPHTFNLSARPDGTYTFSVRANDGAGNVGGAISDQYTLDRSPPPKPTIDSGPGTIGNDKTPTWAFSSEAGAMFKCELVRGTTVVFGLSPCISPATFTLTNQPDATYTLTVIANDSAGNPSPPATVDYELDTAGPAAPTITSAPASPGTNPNPSWSFTGESGGTFECRLVQGSNAIYNAAPCASNVSYDLSSLPEGSYTAEIVQIDAAGNRGTPAASTYVYDAPPGAPIFTEVPLNSSGDTTPTWSFVSDAGTTLECQLSEGATVLLSFAACTSPISVDLSSWPDDVYKFTVRATDGSGRTGPPATTDYVLARLSPAAAAGTTDEPGTPAGLSRGIPANAPSNSESEVPQLQPEVQPPVNAGEARISAKAKGPKRKAVPKRGERGTGLFNLPTDPGELWSAISEVLRFPLLLLVIVLLFLLLQDRIDKKDPKLAMAPMYPDPYVEFQKTQERPAPGVYDWKSLSKKNPR